jgi:hypothetical protein
LQVGREEIDRLNAVINALEQQVAVERRLREGQSAEFDKLQKQVERLTEELRQARPRQPTRQIPREDNVIALRDSPSQWAGLAAANSHWNGPYQQPDRFDANGRRLNPDGTPQTAKPST